MLSESQPGGCSLSSSLRTARESRQETERERQRDEQRHVRRERETERKRERDVREETGRQRDSLPEMLPCTFKTPPVCAVNTAVCHMTHSRFDGTHGGVLNVHTAFFLKKNERTRKRSNTHRHTQQDTAQNNHNNTRNPTTTQTTHKHMAHTSHTADWTGDHYHGHCDCC